MKNKEEIDRIYNLIADELSISDLVYEESKISYEGLAIFLKNHIGFDVKIYPQGSMAIGTTIKTVTKDDDYDLDVVCEVESKFNNPADLKNVIGDVLKNSDRYSKLLDSEGKRCWTLNYSGKNFHLDILPAMKIDNLSTKINITNKNENTGTYSFKTSNPKAYAQWFLSRQEKERSELILKYSQSSKDNIVSLKEYSIHTKLQKAVQLLKRHRDMMYKDVSQKERENKPISIIITTILANIYDENMSLFDIINTFVNEAENFIKIDINGNYNIPNPVNETENFADKWNKHSERRKAFFKWIEQVKHDLIDNNFLMEDGLIKQAEYLKNIFGVNVINNVYAKDANNFKNLDRKYIDHKGIATLTPNKTDIKIRKHNFYGL